MECNHYPAVEVAWPELEVGPYQRGCGTNDGGGAENLFIMDGFDPGSAEDWNGLLWPFYCDWQSNSGHIHGGFYTTY